MLDFRKVLLALSVAGLGLVGTASAQVPTCTMNTAVEAYVAAEGTAQALPPFSITCSGPAPTGAVTFLLTSNVQFTNQAVGTTGNIDVSATDTAGDPLTSVTQSGPNTVQVVFSSLSAAQTITFGATSPLRVNASLAPVSSNITVGVSATGVAVGAAGNPQPLGFVTKAISSVSVASSPFVSLCGLAATTVSGVTTVTIVNGFPDAFQSATDVTAGSAAQMVTQGTRLAITFGNLNPGVNYYVPGTISGTGTLVLSAYAGPTGSTLATYTAASDPPGVGYVLVTSAAPTVWYGVTTSNPAGSTTITIPVTESVPAATGVTSTSTSPVTASVVLVGAASPAYPGYAGTPVYSSAQTVTTMGAGLLNSCSTTLLFPYVINVAGFDTGLAIANASTGSTGTTISPSSGSCNVNFYGTAVPTTNPYATGTIATGTVTAFDIGTVASGFSGYAIAVCNFQGAHGYAFISNGLTTGSGVAANYLAVVLADNGAATPTVTAF
jgi:hypothetical protein